MECGISNVVTLLHTSVLASARSASVAEWPFKPTFRAALPPSDVPSRATRFSVHRGWDVYLEPASPSVTRFLGEVGGRVTRPTLHLLGGTALAGIPPDDVRLLLGQSKTVALLAYLLLAQPGLRQRRDRWPDCSGPHWSAHARSALEDRPHRPIRPRGRRDRIVWGRRGQDRTGSPVVECRGVHDLDRSGAPGSRLELYRGDLMPGFRLPECGELIVGWRGSEQRHWNRGRRGVGIGA